MRLGDENVKAQKPLDVTLKRSDTGITTSKGRTMTTQYPTRGAEVQRRLAELQCKSDSTDMDRVERAGLWYLDRMGFESLNNVIHYTGPDKWLVWAAETMVWTARRIRGKEWREALRGYGQLREYQGRHGFLGCGLSDHATTIQNALEDLIGPR